MQWFLKNKTIIIRLFQVVEIGLVLMWFGVSQVVLGDTKQLLLLLNLGLKFGQVAAILYVLTLTPGILQRFGWLAPVRVVMMLFRRHLGILMYITMFIHMSWTTTLPLISLFGYDLTKYPQLATFQLVGFAAALILLPLILTSNDFSVKYLGKWWKRLHKLTYVALFLIFLHVALIESTKWLILMSCTLIAWVFSWINHFSAKFAKKAPVIKDDTITT